MLLHHKLALCPVDTATYHHYLLILSFCTAELYCIPWVCDRAQVFVITLQVLLLFYVIGF